MKTMEQKSTAEESCEHRQGKKHDCAIQIAVEKLTSHARCRVNGDPRRVLSRYLKMIALIR